MAPTEATEFARLSSSDILARAAALVGSGDFAAARKLADALLTQSRFTDAEAVFRQLCAADPADARGWLGLGRARDRQKKPAEATAAFQKACDLAPDWGEAQRLLGGCKLRDGAILDALRCFERAVAAEPANATHHAALAAAHQQLNDHHATLTHLKRAVELAPRSAPLWSAYLFELSHHPDLSQARVLEEHLRFGKAFGGRPDRFHHAARPDQNRRLRIGYVSGDFYQHSAMLFLRPVLKHHDAGRFEIFAYANVFRPDAVTDEIRSLVHYWRPISALTDGAAAALIHADQIDILVDLSGHTDSNRLPVFGRKPAPVQVGWIGYPATTGLVEIDYKIVNWATKPERQAFYVEHLYRMPGAAACFNPPVDVGPPGPPPALANGFITFGSFNAPRKMSDEVIGIWAAVMRQVRHSRLLLKYAGLHEPERCRPLVEAFAAHGIAAERLDFEGHSAFGEHLRAYGKVDIALDPFPYAGGTTTRNALWSGVPVITLDDPARTGSISASALKLVGLDACVAETTQDYATCAVAVASDPTRLARWRGEIRGKLAASDYFDAEKFTRALESAFVDMWQTWRRTVAAPPHES
jgi:protein O-GlcNAc transferase